MGIRSSEVDSTGEMIMMEFLKNKTVRVRIRIVVLSPQC
jgi:hypothetical protein